MGTDMTRRHLLEMGVGLTGLALVGCSDLGRQSTPDRKDPNRGFGGTLLEPPFTKPDVTLADLDGKPFPFIEATDGQLTVLFFGYTNCPDICPVFLQTIARAREAIGAGPGSRPQVLFVGVDVARDTPEAMRKYLDRIDPTFVGLTGDPVEIDRLITELHMPPVVLEEPGPDGSYMVGHPATATVFSRDNLAHRIYPTGVSAEQGTRMEVWANDLPRLDEGTWK
ncbi:MAG: SCO family protein [Microthrixaceae bacterium]|jgi:protein SCO1/2|nr:SCO family protein [Microthrixaceae bacterium]